MLDISWISFIVKIDEPHHEWTRGKLPEVL